MYIALDDSVNTIINASTNTIAVYDPISNRLIKHITVGACPVGLAYDPQDDVIFAVTNITGTLGVINGTTNTLEANITIGSTPVALIYDAFNAQLYIVQAGTGSIIQLDTSSLLQTLTNSSSNTSGTNNPVNIVLLLLVILALSIVVFIGTYTYYKGKAIRTAMQDLSLISIDDVFKKKVVLEYVYGRLSAVLTKLQRLPNNIPGQMFLIRPQPVDFAVDSETFLNTRLGVHGQNFIKDMTGLSVLI